MKKSKIILAAITVMTLAGGTLAFKAHKGSTIFTSAGAGNCVVALPNFTISNAGSQAFATNVQGLPCVQTLIAQKQ